MTNKTFRVTWDETIRHEAYVEANDHHDAWEVWGTGISASESWELRSSDPIIMEV
jgi:hypothetical protein